MDIMNVLLNGGVFKIVPVETNELAEPKLNKLQEYLYGERAKEFSHKIKKDIVENNRATGKTTRQAMKLIIEAGENPGKKIKITADENTTYPANNCFINQTLLPLLDQLNFKFYVINKVDQTICFDI